jgi:proline iminopeptidase
MLVCSGACAYLRRAGGISRTPGTRAFIMQTNEARLFIRRDGRGVPLVVAHGIPFDHTPYLPLLALDDAADVVLPDLTGMGRSPDPESWDTFKLDDWANDIEAVRRICGLDRFVLFGHSGGGIIALQYALRHPDRLAGLVLCSATASADYMGERDRLLQGRASPEQLQVLAEVFGGSVDLTAPGAVESTLASVLPLYFHGEPRFDAFADSIVRPAAFLHYLSAILPHFDVRASLGGLSAPALVLHGRSDCIHPLTHTSAPLAAALPAATLVVLEESGHFPWLEEEQAFVAALRGFLAKVEIEA